MLSIPQVGDVRYHDRRNGAQPPNDLSRFLEPSHVGITCREISKWVGQARVLLAREQEFRDCFMKAPSVKKRGAYGEKGPSRPVRAD